MAWYDVVFSPQGGGTLPQKVKAPADTFAVRCDFSLVFDTGASIDDATVEADEGITATLVSASGTTAILAISGGTAGADYLVRVTASPNEVITIERAFCVHVRDPVV